MLYEGYYKAADVFVTASEQARGLMFREDYPDDECALFPYAEPKKLTFHGRNCLFPIVVAFFRADGSMDAWGVLEPDGAPFSSEGECALAVEWKATDGNVEAVSHSVRCYLAGDGVVVA